MSTPNERQIQVAACIWCEPQHEHKVMDSDFAMSIANALAAERDAAIEECVGMLGYNPEHPVTVRLRMLKSKGGEK